MKLLFILLFFIFLSKTGFSLNLFETDEFTLKFQSLNVVLDKEKKINEIKIKSFKQILTNILTKKDFNKINTNNILFINSFILNLKINNEKIINNNYYSIVKVNFNEHLIVDYLIDNEIGFVDYLPSKFLILILEQNNIKNHLLSKDNNFYK